LAAPRRWPDQFVTGRRRYLGAKLTVLRFHPPSIPMLPRAGEGARQRAALRSQLDAGMAEPLAVAPRFLVHVGLRLRRLAPLAQGVQVALAVRAAVDNGDDVIAGPGVARTERAAAARASDCYR
jgi:hypothetical protein